MASVINRGERYKIFPFGTNILISVNMQFCYLDIENVKYYREWFKTLQMEVKVDLAEKMTFESAIEGTVGAVSVLGRSHVQ